MKADLITKVREIITKGATEEDQVRSLMILIRKLLDIYDNQDFLTLRLFCSWTAHIEITKSNTWLRILAKVNDALVSCISQGADLTSTELELTQAIGFSELRKELDLFFQYIDISNNLISDNKRRATFVSTLIEIIRDVPLSFAKLSSLKEDKKKIYSKIAQNTIKAGDGVIFRLNGRKRVALISTFQYIVNKF